jgi:hypothetical protein
VRPHCSSSRHATEATNSDGRHGRRQTQAHHCRGRSWQEEGRGNTIRRSVINIIIVSVIIVSID